MIRIFAPLAFFLSLTANAAAPAIDSVAGASGFITTGTVTVYGGLAGDACSDSDTSKPCDSCTTAGVATCTNTPLCPCNKVRIWDGLIVRVNLKEVTGNTFNAVAQLATAANTNFPPVTVANGGKFVDFRWTDICNAATGTLAGCTQAAFATAPAPVVIRIALDKDANGTVSTGDEPVEVTFKVLSPPVDAYEVIGTNLNSNEGILGFKPYPGDEKVYIEDPDTSANFPTLSYGTKAKFVRVFFSDTSLTNAKPADPEFEPVDIALTESGDNLDHNIVDGLENDKLYFFRVALLDEANNVVQYFPDPAIVDPNCTSAPTAQCIYAATPSEVLGLLSKDFNCFVATAAYGTTLEPKLQVFRDFRFKVLIQNPYGLKFVRWYYKYGPFAARYISDKPVLRSIARGLLWPAYGFSYLALKFGFALAFAFSLMFLTTAIGLPLIGARRVLKRE